MINPSRTYIIANDSDYHDLDLTIDDQGNILWHSNGGTRCMSRQMAERTVIALRALLSGTFDRAATELTLRMEEETRLRRTAYQTTPTPTRTETLSPPTLDLL